MHIHTLISLSRHIFDGKQSTPPGELPRSVYTEKYVYDLGKAQEIMTCRLETSQKRWYIQANSICICGASHVDRCLHRCDCADEGKRAGTREPQLLLPRCCSVAQLCSTLCNTVDARLPCPSPSPGACSNSYPLSQ